MNLSKQLDQYRFTEDKILDYFTKRKEPNTQTITEYSANSGTPLVVVYYFLDKNLDNNFKDDIIRLAKFYGLKVDVEL